METERLNRPTFAEVATGPLFGAVGGGFKFRNLGNHYLAHAERLGIDLSSELGPKRAKMLLTAGGVAIGAALGQASSKGFRHLYAKALADRTDRGKLNPVEQNEVARIRGLN